MNAFTPYDKTNAIAISTGSGYHTVVLLNTGEVMTVGRGQSGQLGDGTTNKNQLVSMDASGTYDKTNVVAISSGNKHTVVLLNTEVMTVGSGQSGQLGDGTIMINPISKYECNWKL